MLWYSVTLCISVSGYKRFEEHTAYIFRDDETLASIYQVIWDHNSEDHNTTLH
jgi:hypothetical protein